MNAVDLLLVGLLLLAILGGTRVGFVHRVLTWGGLLAGALIATRTVPAALTALDGGGAALRLFLGVLVLAATVAIVSTVFSAVGARLRARVTASSLSGLDRVAGGIAAGLAVLVAAWFLFPAAAGVPGEVARQVRASRSASLIATVAPPAPDAARTVRALIDQSRFPEVLADLQPSPETGPPPTEIPVTQEVVAAATASTVNVEASGCGRRFDGSGVTVADGVVLTNAHVVAGADRVSVRRPDGAVREAVVVVFDPDRDLAVLEVTDLGQAARALAPASPGDAAVVIGYPGGQDTPRVAPVRIEQRRTALGRDIYGRAPTQREVLFLSAELRQGDSGSPVIDTEGRVIGIVFAISPDVRTTAYALDLTEVEHVLAAPRTPGETGRCIA